MDKPADSFNGWPTVEEFIEAAGETSDGLDPMGLAAIEQGITFVQQVAKTMCKNITYGSPEWKDAWAAATVTIYNMLTGLQELIPGLNPMLIETIALEFMLIGNGNQREELDNLLADLLKEEDGNDES